MATALQNSITRLGNKLDEHKKDAVLTKVALGLLAPYSRQRRTQFDEAGLKELAESIKVVGVLEPLLVRPVGEGKFEIIAGERRMRAAREAGLVEVPALVRAMDDATAYMVHLAENIQRENLSTLDLAQSVQRDLNEAGGDLGVVAARYGKQKAWVSKLSSIAQGGAAMAELVEEGVTADRAVLASVASLERRAPEQAKVLTRLLKAAPEKSKKRDLAEQYMRDNRLAAKGRSKAAANSVEVQRSKAAEAAPREPAWRGREGVPREPTLAMVGVRLSPLSQYVAEFDLLSKKHGRAQLVLSARHPDAAFAIVQFGKTTANQRVYLAQELQLLTVR